MRGRAAVPVVLLAALLPGTPEAFGQGERGKIVLKAEEPDGKAAQKWAVVVGVNEYLDPDLPPLPYCMADAELVAKRLTERCGYEENSVLIITDSQPKVHLRPLKRNLQVQVQDWLKRAGPKDTVLVFFAGHGFLDARGQGFLATQDCERENLGLTALRTDDLRDMLRQCKASQKLLILDCCHAAGDRGDKTGASPEELGESFRRAEGLVTLASCKKDQTSRDWPVKRQGLFTYFLAEGLSGKADADGDGVVDSDELYQYCLEQVSQVGQKELNARQTPVRIIGEDVVGRFAMARVKRRAGRRGGATPFVPVGEPVEHPRWLTWVALSRDGRLGMSGSNGTVKLWDMRGDETVIRKLIDRPRGFVSRMAFSPDGRLALTNGSAVDDNGAQLWELPSGRPVGPPLDHGETMSAVAFSPDGRTALTAGGHEVRLWETATRRPLVTLTHHFNVTSAAFSPDGQTVLTGSGISLIPPEDPAVYGMQGEARLWSVGTGKLIGEPLRSAARVQTVGFGKAGRFYTGSTKGQIRLWRPDKDGPVPNVLKGEFSCAAFSPDGSRLVTGGKNEARFWDVETGRPIGATMAHVASISVVAFSPDGALILIGSGSEDYGEAQLRDARTGHRVGPPMVHQGVVSCAAFSGDGRKFMTGGFDNQARLWEIVGGGE